MTAPGVVGVGVTGRPYLAIASLLSESARNWWHRVTDSLRCPSNKAAGQTAVVVRHGRTATWRSGTPTALTAEPCGL